MLLSSNSHFNATFHRIETYSKAAHHWKVTSSWNRDLYERCTSLKSDIFECYPSWNRNLYESCTSLKNDIFKCYTSWNRLHFAEKWDLGMLHFMEQAALRWKVTSSNATLHGKENYTKAALRLKVTSSNATLHGTETYTKATLPWKVTSSNATLHGTGCTSLKSEILECYTSWNRLNFAEKWDLWMLHFMEQRLFESCTSSIVQ